MDCSDHSRPRKLQQAAFVHPRPTPSVARYPLFYKWKKERLLGTGADGKVFAVTEPVLHEDPESPEKPISPQRAAPVTLAELGGSDSLTPKRDSVARSESSDIEEQLHSPLMRASVVGNQGGSRKAYPNDVLTVQGVSLRVQRAPLDHSPRTFALKEVLVTDNERRAAFTKKQLDVLVALPDDATAHIVRHYAAHLSACALCVLMEYVPGGSVHSILLKLGALNERTVRIFARHTARALKDLHERGMIHRDVKAANLLVTNDGVVKLGDFGCCALEAARPEWPPGLCGTSMWMAPESIKEQATTKSDIWAFGCTIIEMATGRPPWFEAGFTNEWAAMFHISQCGRGPPIPPHLSRQAHAFLSACFHVDEARRPTAEQCLEFPFLKDDFDASREDMRPPTPDVSLAEGGPLAPVRERGIALAGEDTTATSEYAPSQSSTLNFAVVKPEWGDVSGDFPEVGPDVDGPDDRHDEATAAVPLATADLDTINQILQEAQLAQQSDNTVTPVASMLGGSDANTASLCGVGAPSAGVTIEEPIWLRIFAFLDVDSLCCIEATSRGLNALALHPSQQQALWRRLFVAHFGAVDVIRATLRSDWRGAFRRSFLHRSTADLGGRFKVVRCLGHSANVFEAVDMHSATHDIVAVRIECLPRPRTVHSKVHAMSAARIRHTHAVYGVQSPLRLNRNSGSSSSLAAARTATPTVEAVPTKPPTAVCTPATPPRQVQRSQPAPRHSPRAGPSAPGEISPVGQFGSHTLPMTVTTASSSPFHFTQPSQFSGTAGTQPGARPPDRRGQAGQTPFPDLVAGLVATGLQPSHAASTPDRPERPEPRPHALSAPRPRNAFPVSGGISRSGAQKEPPPSRAGERPTTHTQAEPDVSRPVGERAVSRGANSTLSDASSWWDLYEVPVSPQSQRPTTAISSLPKCATSHQHRMLRHLEAGGVRCVPRPLHVSDADIDGCNVLVTTAEGPNLNELLLFCGNQLSMRCVFTLALKMLTALSDMHDRDVVHGSISPSNIVMGRGEHSRSLFFINLSHARIYRDPKTRRPISSLPDHSAGTAKRSQESLCFCSTFVQRGCTPTPRDDVIAVGYVLCYLIHGGLPWIDMDAATTECLAGATTRDAHLSNRRQMPGLDVNRVVRAKNRYLDFLSKAPPVQLFHFLRSGYGLKQNEVPDYVFLCSIIRQTMKLRGWSEDGDFDWSSRLHSGRLPE